MKDVIEDILETVNFKSAIYFKHGFCGAWGMEVEAGKFAQFHFVTSGNCVLQIEEKIHQLSRGDLVIFPNGHPHRIKAIEGAVCKSGMEVVGAILNGKAIFEEGQMTTQLICGHYELDRELSHFLLEDLPDWVIIKNEDYGRFDLMNTVLELIIEELSTKKAGYQIVVLRFAEILFVSILRHYYLKLSSNTPATTNFLKDEAIYKSVNFIHHNIHATLSIEKLSRYSGISRTLFIERFKKSVGNTPLGYIKTWRMTKAKQLLKKSDFTLGEITEQIGYTSPSAFNRAFKQTFEISPKRYRRLELAK